MRVRAISRVVGLVMLTTVVGWFATGCAYMGHRGRDAMDFLDIGLTVNDSVAPTFEVYFDVFSVLPIGYSSVDANFFGLSHRQFGKLPYANHSWGAVLLGSERRGIGEFDPANPYHARADQAGLTDRPTFKNGVVGLASGGEAPPWRHFFEINRGIHVGWLGIDLTCRISELVDFLLGWSTIDIMGDDVAP